MARATETLRKSLAPPLHVSTLFNTGGTMSYRQSNRGRERDERPWRAAEPRDEHGLHGQERREYRGRESYEQQSRGGEGGRSGMFPERRIASDMHERYHNNADEDARGYQNISRRTEFVGADRD